MSIFFNEYLEIDSEVVAMALDVAAVVAMKLRVAKSRAYRVRVECG